MTLFIDSSALFAASNQADGNHQRALEVLSSDEPKLTTDHVLVESWLLINSRGSQFAADQLWDRLRTGTAIIDVVGAADLEAAWRIGEAFPDQDFSIVDRTSFAVMERLGIRRVASFDDDFAIYRFGPRRDRAFEVVR